MRGSELLVEISIFGDVQVSRDIKRISTRAGNMNPAFAAIFDRLTEIEGEQFHSQGSRGGATWAPLKPATIESKRRKGYAHPELAEFATEALYEALSSHVNQNQERIFNETWAVFRVLGEPGEYGLYQHYGVPENNLVPRPLFRLTSMDRRQMVKQMQMFLFRGVTTWDWGML